MLELFCCLHCAHSCNDADASASGLTDWNAALHEVHRAVMGYRRYDASAVCDLFSWKFGGPAAARPYHSPSAISDYATSFHFACQGAVPTASDSWVTIRRAVRLVFDSAHSDSDLQVRLGDDHLIEQVLVEVRAVAAGGRSRRPGSAGCASAVTQRRRP